MQLLTTVNMQENNIKKKNEQHKYPSPLIYTVSALLETWLLLLQPEEWDVIDAVNTA